MNTKRQRLKQRRRAHKLADQAWEAMDEENLQLALKIIRRAVDADPSNPRLWCDQGLLLRQSGDKDAAVESFQGAICLAPDFAEAYAQLAAIRVGEGRVREAVALQSKALTYDPQAVELRKRLADYRVLLGDVQAIVDDMHAHETVHESALAQQHTTHQPPISLGAIDWEHASEALTRLGCVVVPELIDTETCAAVRAWFAEESRWAKTVIMDKPRFGRGTYRYFQPPLPDLILAIRRQLYRHLADIVNNWLAMTTSDVRYPAEWCEFSQQCTAAGQTSPAAILLKYEAGGFNAAHQDLRGKVYFPLQLAIVLSPLANTDSAFDDGFQGGDFLFCDARPGKQRLCLSAGLGDGILFCTRHRLIQVGGTWGLQPVLHGVEEITAGTRFVLGVPFHDYNER